MDMDTCEVEAQSPAETSSGPAKFLQKNKAMLKYGPLGLASSLVLALFIVVLSKTSMSESSKKEIQSHLMNLKESMDTHLMDPNNIDGLPFMPESSKKEIKSQLVNLKKSTSNFPEILMSTISSEADLPKKKMPTKTPHRKSVSTCDKEWTQFHWSCYYFTPSKSTWEVARSLCKEKGADLAIIKSAEEQDFLVSHIKNYFYWIGLTDIKEEGKWRWVDGTASVTSVTFWKNGEPNNQGNEDCGILYYGGQWSDMICSDSTIYAICEKTLK